MQNFWILPFGMIAYWLAVAIVEWIRTPNPPRDHYNRLNARPTIN